jgi:glutamate/tyrosine decarboxylase-like PLP-dependent enzyme
MLGGLALKRRWQKRRAAEGKPTDKPNLVMGINVQVMVAPFLDQELAWDFRLPRVVSINTSGHKYGLVYPGVGWIVWRDKDALPDELIFWVNYLGDNMPTFASTSRGLAPKSSGSTTTSCGSASPATNECRAYARNVATRMSSEIEKLGPFRLLTRGDELLVFAFTLNEGIQNCTVFDVSNALRERGWQVPAYTFPENDPTSPRCALSSAEASATIWPTCWSPIWSASCHASSSSRRRCTTQLREQRSATRQEKPCAAGSHTPDLHS